MPTCPTSLRPIQRNAASAASSLARPLDDPSGAKRALAIQEEAARKRQAADDPYQWDHTRPTPDHEAARIRQKAVTDWTTTEARKMMNHRSYIEASGPEFQDAADRVTKWFQHAFPNDADPDGPIVTHRSATPMVSEEDRRAVDEAIARRQGAQPLTFAGQTSDARLTGRSNGDDLASASGRPEGPTQDATPAKIRDLRDLMATDPQAYARLPEHDRVFHRAYEMHSRGGVSGQGGYDAALGDTPENRRNAETAAREAAVNADPGHPRNGEWTAGDQGSRGPAGPQSIDRFHETHGSIERYGQQMNPEAAALLDDIETYSQEGKAPTEAEEAALRARVRSTFSENIKAMEEYQRRISYLADGPLEQGELEAMAFYGSITAGHQQKIFQNAFGRVAPMLGADLKGTFGERLSRTIKDKLEEEIPDWTKK